MTTDRMMTDHEHTIGTGALRMHEALEAGIEESISIDCAIYLIANVAGHLDLYCQSTGEALNPWGDISERAAAIHDKLFSSPDTEGPTDEINALLARLDELRLRYF